MGERKIRWGRVLLMAGLAVLLFGCMYGSPYGNGSCNGYGGYDDQYYGNGQYVDPLTLLFGPAVGAVEHLLVGPIVGSVLGGSMGYGNGQPYYHDRYNNNGYNDRYYDDNYNGNYNDNNYRYGPYNPW
jgi:hypothetical protein